MRRGTWGTSISSDTISTMNNSQFDQVVEYVIAQLNDGVGEAVLRQELAAGKYPQKYIEQVFAEIHAPVNLQEVVPVKESLTANIIDAAAHATSNASRTQGRLGRRGFLTTLLTTYAIVFVPVGTILIAFGLLQQVVSRPAFTITMLFITPLLFGLIVWTIWLRLAICVRRLHDMGQSGYWALLSVLGLFDFVLYVVLSFTPGDPQENEHGLYDSEINPLRILRFKR